MSRRNYFINNPDNTIPDSITSSILKNSDALTFHKKQKDYYPTPLVSLSGLAAKYGIEKLYIKDESHRLGLDAFKGVGALYAINKLISTNAAINTLCTATDGNHGRAVAWSARHFGKNAIVVVPGDTTIARIKAIENEGARVHRTEGNYDEACDLASEMSKKKGWALIQDTASVGYEEIPAQIMAGYLTIFREMEESLNVFPEPGIDLVFLQAGVGSFAASATWYYLNRYGNKRPKIVITEPLEADAIFYSFESGIRSTSPAGNRTIMAGLNCNTPSTSAWEIIKSGIDISLKMDDEYAIDAIRELYYPERSDNKIMAGESGAAGLAGFLAIMTGKEYKPLIDILDISDKTRILVINTEGATDPSVFKKIISLDKLL